MKEYINNLVGPIFIFGAGGFIGINLFLKIIKYRNDVYAITQNPFTNWRITANKIPIENIITCDINNIQPLHDLIFTYKPKTIFNLAAYGAYSNQIDFNIIYQTNFNSTINLIELLKKIHFISYIQAGSSSEYGINSKAPLEDSNCFPNSHYAVSKVATYHAIKYYGYFEDLPVAQLRIYSAYGPWEEPDRLIPTLISLARKNRFPNFVDKHISRDFIYVDDVCSAFILSALNITKNKGQVFNIGTGINTTIENLAFLVKNIFGINEVPSFSGMPNRKWDVVDWYSDSSKAHEILGWRAKVDLVDGINLVNEWQLTVDYDNVQWNYNKYQ